MYTITRRVFKNIFNHMCSLHYTFLDWFTRVAGAPAQAGSRQSVYAERAVT